MGCDIHLKVEVRENGKWRPAEPKRVCDECKGTGQRESECYWCKGTGNNAGFNSRAYNTFGVLANVRNGTWGDPVPYIAEPRGLPADLSPELKRKSAHNGDDEDEDDWCFGDRSQSWLTLRELLTYNWDARVESRAFVSGPEFAEWDAKGRGHPSSYCAETSMPKVSNDEMRRLLVERPDAADRLATQVTWSEPVARLCREFHDEFIPALVKLGAPDDVRIVFGFDS